MHHVIGVAFGPPNPWVVFLVRTEPRRSKEGRSPARRSVEPRNSPWTQRLMGVCEDCQPLCGCTCSFNERSSFPSSSWSSHPAHVLNGGFARHSSRNILRTRASGVRRKTPTTGCVFLPLVLGLPYFRMYLDMSVMFTTQITQARIIHRYLQYKPTYQTKHLNTHKLKPRWIWKVQ